MIQLTFKFFDFKWRKVPCWGLQTETIFRKWYLVRYGDHNVAGLRAFLWDKTRILEAGCGLGRGSKFFATLNPAASIIAMDQFPDACRVARRTLSSFLNCAVVRGDITHFRNLGTFDFISCDQVLHHTPDPVKTLKHIFFKLAPGGILNFSVCCTKNPLRKAVDDAIMARARTKTPRELWQFCVVVARFGQALHELKAPLHFVGKKHPSLQRFVHQKFFRCWYNSKVGFDLSVSSNYDWFSHNPRYGAT